MKYEVVFHQKENGEVPVEEYMSSLPAKQQAKIGREIDLLEDLLYFLFDGNKFVLVHGFTKEI